MLVAATPDRVHALARAPIAAPERSSDFTVHVRAFRCVDPGQTTLVIGDVAAQAIGGDRYLARVSGRGSVLVRASPWADVVPVGREGFDAVTVEIDGGAHAIEVELDACEED